MGEETEKKDSDNSAITASEMEDVVADFKEGVMDGSINNQMDKWDTWMHGQMNGWIDRLMNGCSMNSCMDDGWTD